VLAERHFGAFKEIFVGLAGHRQREWGGDENWGSVVRRNRPIAMITTTPGIDNAREVTRSEAADCQAVVIRDDGRGALSLVNVIASALPFRNYKAVSFRCPN